MSSAALRLYRGAVMHRRLTAPRYSFRYRVFSLLLDIDRLDEAHDGFRLFSHNRFNLLSFHDRDHGAKDGSALRPWIDGVLRRAGVELAGGRVRLLCYPRVLGLAFNPLSLWFCEHADGGLQAVLCEVRNTFGEWHGYLLHRDGERLNWPVTAEATKVFYVSPFLPLQGRYRFRLSRPTASYTASISFYPDGHDGAQMVAIQTGAARHASDGGLLLAAALVPTMAFKVIVAIHWQALKLWLRGATFRRKPQPPSTEISR